MQLTEKQKLCFNYGVTETQMRRLFAEARARKGVTGTWLLELLEAPGQRVFRAGSRRRSPPRASSSITAMSASTIAARHPSFRVTTAQW